MGFNTKLRFNCAKFWQNSNDTIELSGSTSIGTAQYLESLTGVTALTIPTVEWVTGQTGAIDASNGLTRQGDYITLGGSLTGDTTINGAHTLALNPFTFNVSATNIGLTGIVNVTGNTNLNDNLTVGSDTHLGGSLGVTGATNLDNCLTVATAISGNTTLDILGATTLHNTLNVTNQTTIGGALTLCTHSAGSTSNPIMVLDGNVVKCVAASSFDVTAVNGITATGNEVKLGGTSPLCETTTICGAGFNMNLGTAGNELGAFTIDAASVAILSDGIVGITTTNDIITLDAGITCVALNSVATYNADKSSSYTLRSLPDVHYVTGLTSQAILTASNGLCKTGNNVCWGAPLTGNVNIQGGSSRNIVFGALTSFNFGTQVGICNSSVYGTTTAVGLEWTNNASSSDKRQICIDANAMLIKDSLCDIGLTYAADYCFMGKSNPRWIPDAAWVTGQTSTSGIQTASNGLTKTGTDVKLGGNLGVSTIINGVSGTYDFTIQDLKDMYYHSTRNNCTAILRHDMTGDASASWVWTDISGGDEARIKIESAGALIEKYTSSNNSVNILTNDSGITITDEENSKGAIYGGDYCDNFTNRSLVDKQYVDAASGGIGGSNGLSRDGDNIVLGGTLTGNTVITGSSTLLVSAPHEACDVQYFKFNSTPTISGHEEGRLYYDNCTLNFEREISGVTLQIGEEAVIRVTNVTGNQFDNGEIAYVNGSNTGLPSIALADASDFIKATQTIGVAIHDIPDNGEGYITTLGIVHDVNTVGFSDGDLLWLSDTILGGYTNVRPSYPSYSVSIGMVINGGLTEGDIYVKILYVPNYTEYGLFTGYTATTNTTLNEKLDITDFNTYSGATDIRITANEAVTALAITGVTNGICNYSTHNACLGGVLSAPVTLSGTQLLTMGDLNGICMSVANTTDIGINAKSNGAIYVKSQSGTVASSSDMTNAVGISLDYNASIPMLITDNKPTPRGLQYNEDYTSTFNDRSLVDKYYVDSIATGLNVHAAVVAATTIADGDIVLSGNSGTIDSINVTDIISSINRILIKNQTNAALNGIYSASTGDWGRTEDYNFAPSGEISNGDLIPVLTGVTNANSQWINVSVNPIVSGDSINFSVFSQQQGVIEGDGICVTTVGSNKQVAVKLSPSNSGLCIASTALELDYTTFRYGLTCSITTGKVDVNAQYGDSIGTKIPVRIDTGGTNTLYVDQACFSYTTASNGLTKVDCNITLGGALTGDTTVCGNSGVYDLNFTELDSFNLGFDNTSTITDSAGTPRGLQYAGNYAATFLDNSLVSKYFVNNAITGSTLTFNNGLTKQDDTISWGGSLTGDTQVIYGAGRICMENGGTSTVTMLSDNSSVVIQNTTMQLRSCTNASCDGTITLADTGTIAIATNNATTGITITDSGSGVGAVYTADYESNFVARSLITKQYVDTEIGNLTGITSQAITGATNGLTKTGQSVKLGGTLSEDTNIFVTSANTLYLMDSGYNHGLYIAPEFTRNKLTAYDTATGNEAIVDTTSGVRPTTVISAYGTSDTSIVSVEPDLIKMCVNTQDVFTIRDTGVVFESDYSGNYTNLSVVDKCYVDTEIGNLTGTTSQAITGATNGLTKVSQDVKLGGTLTENTTLTVGENTFKLDDGASSYLQWNSGQTYILHDDGISDFGYLTITKGSISTQTETATDYSEMLTQPDRVWMSSCSYGLAGSGNKITLNSDGFATWVSENGLIFSSISGKTIQYGGDYESNFVARSLVTKQYVDGATGSLDANNGLSRQGDNITLGGALTGDTTISGAYTLALSSLTAFNATATNIGLTGIVTATGAVHATSTLGVSGATQIGGTLGVTGALTTTTTAQIGGTLTLDTVTTGDVGTDEVMLITSGGVVKKVDASTLGEDNNIYSKITYTSSQTLTTGSSYVILVNHGVPVTITLPATPLEGQVFKIKDVSSGGALTNNITIERNGKDMDRTPANALINTDSGALELVYDSALGWFTLAFVN